LYFSLPYNPLVHLTIEKLIYGGDGLARLPPDEHGRGKAVFVPFVLAEEQVEAALLEQRPGFARAHAEHILQPSPQRIEPGCPYFQRCGGCQYQHTNYEHQLEIKTAILKENLRRIAKVELDQELHIHQSPPWNYRNRTRLKIQTNPEFAIGYYRSNSHELLPVTECPISSALINRAISALWELGDSGTIRDIEFFANAEDTALLVEAYCDAEPDTKAGEEFANQLRRILPEIAGVVFFGSPRAGAVSKPHTVSGAAELTYNTQTVSYRVTTGSFFQVNRHLTDELTTIVTAGRSGTMALDLYAGVGLFSSVLYREFKNVIAVESSPTSHADLLYNSPPNVKAVRATVDQYLDKVDGKLRPDLVVVDPPRSGLGDRVIAGINRLEPPCITYVSCDPATLSRDLARLLNLGYRIEQAYLVDLFPQTYHLESVFHLAR
jgi:23S rRNA (uracil1939-C5)-methyltransferase